jgi:hypothetical protein
LAKIVGRSKMLIYFPSVAAAAQASALLANVSAKLAGIL